MRYLRTNTATIVTVGPFLDATDGVTLETGLTITNEKISFTVDLNNGSAPTLVLDNVTGATSGTSNDLNYITGCDAALMQLELAAADVNYLGRAFLTITDAANHCPVFHEFMILPAVVFDALIAGTDLLQTDLTQIAGSAVSTSSAQLGVNVVNWKGSAAAAMTGDSYARLGAPAGASVSADVAAVKAQTAAIETDTQDLQTQIGTDGAGLTAIGDTRLANLDATVSSRLATAGYTAPLDASGIRTSVGLATANLDTQLAALPTDADVQTAATAALNAYDPPTNAEMEARTLAAAAYFDPAADTVAHVTLVDTTTTNTDMVAAAPSAAAVRAEIDSNSTQLAAIVADTNELQTNQGNWLTATGFATPTNITAASGITLASTQGAVTFGQVKIAANVSGEGALDVRNSNAYGHGLYAEGGNFGLRTEGGNGGQGNFGTNYGQVNSGATGARNFGSTADVEGVDEAGIRAALGMAAADLDTQLAAIGIDGQDVADALLLAPSGVAADGSAMDYLADIVDDTGTTLPGTLATIAGYVDTEVAAIKAKTDNLPAAPAATGDIPTAAAIADAVWDEAIAGHAGVGSTGEALAAAGSAGDPWATALPGAYGSGTAGKIIGDNINATVSSRAAAGDEMDLVDAPNATAVTAIQSGLATPTNITAGTITTVTNIPTQQVRDAMMLAPSAGAPAAGSIDEHLDDILVDTGTTLPALVAGLDGATVTVVSSVSGGTISVHVADTWLFTVTSAQLGLDVYESLGLVVKRSERQPDDAALLLLRTGTGLVRIGGAAPASAASGELTYDNTSFTGRVGLAETQGLRAGQYRWWLKCFDTTPAPDEAFTVATGEFVLLAAGLEAVV